MHFVNCQRIPQQLRILRRCYFSSIFFAVLDSMNKELKFAESASVLAENGTIVQVSSISVHYNKQNYDPLVFLESP